MLLAYVFARDRSSYQSRGKSDTHFITRNIASPKKAKLPAPNIAPDVIPPRSPPKIGFTPDVSVVLFDNKTAPAVISSHQVLKVPMSLA